LTRGTRPPELFAKTQLTRFVLLAGTALACSSTTPSSGQQPSDAAADGPAKATDVRPVDAGAQIGGDGGGGTGGGPDAGDARSDEREAGDTSAPVPLDAGIDAPEAVDAAPCPGGLIFYADEDHDGYGGATSRCVQEAPPGWVVRGGDCDDANGDVHPGQVHYFAVAYSPAAKPDWSSYDYDCDGMEVSDQPSFTGASVGAFYCLSGTGCRGSGYLPASPARPAAPGLNPTCGSRQHVTCESSSGGCGEIHRSDMPPVGCR
jgi:hypothetical protein